MKARAILLLALVIGGFMVMLQSIDEFEEMHFSALLEDAHSDFNLMTFSKPPVHGLEEEKWVVSQEQEIDELLNFLQHYRIRKIPPTALNLDDTNEQFTIELTDDVGNQMIILIDENLIIQNSLLYFEIVNGPLDVEWLVHFFVANKQT